MNSTIRSFAKINIGLRIVARRRDGYHDIETVFKLIGLHDLITLSTNDSGRLQLTCSVDSVPTDDTNLAARAVHLLSEETGSSIGLDVHIEKNIPMGAGLGGGSSNGAAVVVEVNRLLSLGISDHRLMELGSELGSDVPFFVGCYLGKGSTAWGKGRGEILDYFDWPLTERILLIYPGIHISTAWAYANFSNYLREENRPKMSSFGLTNTSKSIKFSPLLDKPLFFGNDFEPLVLANHHEIRQIREALASEKPVLCQMSGSGSTVYGLFEKERNLDSLLQRFPGCKVFLTEFLP